jgi:hypothetical protein
MTGTFANQGYNPPGYTNIGAGAANTGAGGGAFGTNGGSGVVAIRYPSTFGEAVSTTGTVSVTISGGYRIYKWTTSGTITF